MNLNLNPFQLGLFVAAILAILTIVEYFYALEVGSDGVRFIGLALAALAKTVLIVYFFMHFNRLWRSEAH